MNMRNEKLNQFKAIAAFWVVFIHCKFPANLGNAVSIIARWAVPFFLLFRDITYALNICWKGNR